MKRIRPLRAVLLTAALLCALPAAGCEKEMPGRLDGGLTSEQTAVTSGTAGATGTTAPRGKAFDTPRFAAGTYRMTASSVNETVFYQGQQIPFYEKTTQSYTYRITVTEEPDGAWKAQYTIERIMLRYDTKDETETVDTADTGKSVEERDERDQRDEFTSVYFDLIGQSFTADISRNGTVSLSGLDKIHRNVPDSADVIREDNMREVVSDVFYPLPDKLHTGDTWQLTQSGIVNTYGVSSTNSQSVFVDIVGGELALPAPYTENEITYTYTSCDPLSGTLTVNRDNRMIQEQASYQELKGKAVSGQITLTFKRSTTSSAQISPAD